LLSPLVTLGTDSHAALTPVTKLLILEAITEATAAEPDYHIDIVSRNVATADVTEIFVFPEIRTDIFWHL
jgi:hypothetical protein